MIEIEKLNGLTFDELMSFGNLAYTSLAEYEVIRKESDKEIALTMKYSELRDPYVRIWQNGNKAFERYSELISEGNSFGAYDGETLAGFVITEKRKWNNTLWLEMIQVSEAYRGKGVGSSMMSLLELHAGSERVRAIDIETQNTNVPAIKFYKKNGYEIAGLNLKMYDPKDAKDEIAIFMTKTLNS